MDLAVIELLSAADCFFDCHEYAQALEAFEKCLLLDDGNIEARTGVALSLIQLGRFADAVPVLELLEEVLPDSAELQDALAESLFQMGRYEETETKLKRLLEKVPDNVMALNRLGRLYYQQERYPDANKCFSKVIECDPRNVEALSYMGMMLIRFFQFDNAMAALLNTYTIEPQNVLVLNNLGRACKMMGRHAEALEWYGKALEVEPDNTAVVGNYLFSLNYCHGLSPEFIAAEHFRLATTYTRDVPESQDVFSGSASSRLRIGYVSGDLYTHSVAYFLEPILQHHDYGRFEVFCYSLGTTRDATTERLKSLPCCWCDLAGCAPDVVARQVRSDRIDILVDLSGHTGDNRLGVFASRSAPVQVSWIGYPNTTGLPEMDYYITDNVCDPPGMTEHLFSERLWRLPRIFSTYLPPMEFPPVVASPLIDNGYVTFGSFNNFAKVTVEQISLWAKIMARVPGSRLYLKSMALGDRSVKQAVLARFESEGVAAERIFMRVVTSTPLEHLQEYGRVDIALDTFPYNGTTTTCEAIWMGTPVITLCGVTHVSRVGASLLQAAGCSDLVAHSAEEYLEKAVELACDPDRLNYLREELRSKMARSPLMDGAGVTKELEEAFLVMHETAGWKRRDY